jgi:hypothetical protein
MGYSIYHKGYVFYDSCANKFCVSRNIVFFENQCFFTTYVESLPKISILPYFDELSPLPDRFKLGIVYTRGQPSLPLFETDSSFKTIPTTSPEIYMSSEIGSISSPMPFEHGPC